MSLYKSKYTGRYLVHRSHHSGLKAPHFILSADISVSAPIQLVISPQKLMEGYRKMVSCFRESREGLRKSVGGYRKSVGSLRESGEGFRESVPGYHQSVFAQERFDLD
jgi:hypothetical protein